MRALRNTADGVALVDVPVPDGPGELVAIRSASICGSDFGYLAAGSTFVLGHELAGITESGTPVAVEAVFGCGGCAECAAGRYNRCPAVAARTPGLSVDGGIAEYFRAPASSLVPLPVGLDVADASLVEPTAVAVHGLRLAGFAAPGTAAPNALRSVAVVGGGSIGLLAVAAARHLGAARVGLAARHAAQQEAGERLGAEVAAGPYDVVVEAAGTASALARAVELAAPGGTVVVLGVHPETLAVPGIPALMKELRVVSSMAYARDDGVRDVDVAAAMLAAEPGIAATLVTHRFPLADAAEAFRVAGDRAAGAIKVVVEP